MKGSSSIPVSPSLPGHHLRAPHSNFSLGPLTPPSPLAPPSLTRATSWVPSCPAGPWRVHSCPTVPLSALSPPPPAFSGQHWLAGGVPAEPREGPPQQGGPPCGCWWGEAGSAARGVGSQDYQPLCSGHCLGHHPPHCGDEIR